MSGKAAKISNSELEVLRVLWTAQDGMSFSQIRSHPVLAGRWQNSTIKTLLDRLRKKGIVSIEEKDVYYYKALVSEADYHEYAAVSLMNKLFAGSAGSMVAALVKSNRLKESDLEELRNLLNRAGETE